MIVWIASYPRSGNTFFRIVLNKIFGFRTYSIYKKITDINQSSQNLVNPGDLPGNLDEVRNLKEIYFIKTHEIPENVDLKEGDKVLYLVRDGRACSLSFAKYLKKYNKLDGDVLQDLLCGKISFGAWGNHVHMWKNVEKTIIKFEDLIDDPMSIADLLARDFNIKPSGKNIPTFEELHEIDPKFFSSGKNDSWKEEFSNDDLRIFWKNNGNVMVDMGYVDSVPVFDK